MHWGSSTSPISHLHQFQYNISASDKSTGTLFGSRCSPVEMAGDLELPLPSSRSLLWAIQCSEGRRFSFPMVFLGFLKVFLKLKVFLRFSYGFDSTPAKLPDLSTV